MITVSLWIMKVEYKVLHIVISSDIFSLNLQVRYFSSDHYKYSVFNNRKTLGKLLTF